MTALARKYWASVGYAYPWRICSAHWAVQIRFHLYPFSQPPVYLRVLFLVYVLSVRLFLFSPHYICHFCHNALMFLYVCACFPFLLIKFVIFATIPVRSPMDNVSSPFPLTL